jgi:hypothetical protein
MKKLIILFALVPMALFGQENKESKFIELNIGLAAIDGYDFDDAFPGASILFGQTRQISDNGIFEYQVGIAAPSIVTGKVAIGYGNLKNNIALAVRPWPLLIGPQAKIGNFTFSFEVGTDSEISFDAGLISTVAYRWTIGGKKKNEIKVIKE